MAFASRAPAVRPPGHSEGVRAYIRVESKHKVNKIYYLSAPPLRAGNYNRTNKGSYNPPPSTP